VIVMAVGVVLAGWGAWDLLPSYTRVMGVGLFLVGVGTAVLGGTNGFTSYTDVGRTAGKIGITAYVIGLPVLLYAIWSRI